jgi:hypothetical protein
METSFAAGLAASMLSVELRLGASMLWRGLPCVDMDDRAAESDFWPAALAAKALASFS